MGRLSLSGRSRPLTALFLLLVLAGSEAIHIDEVTKPYRQGLVNLVDASPATSDIWSEEDAGDGMSHLARSIVEAKWDEGMDLLLAHLQQPQQNFEADAAGGEAITFMQSSVATQKKKRNHGRNRPNKPVTAAKTISDSPSPRPCSLLAPSRSTNVMFTDFPDYPIAPTPVDAMVHVRKLAPEPYRPSMVALYPEGECQEQNDCYVTITAIDSNEDRDIVPLRTSSVPAGDYDLRICYAKSYIFSGYTCIDSCRLVLTRDGANEDDDDSASGDNNSSLLSESQDAKEEAEIAKLTLVDDPLTSAKWIFKLTTLMASYASEKGTLSHKQREKLTKLMEAMRPLATKVVKRAEPKMTPDGSSDSDGQSGATFEALLQTSIEDIQRVAHDLLVSDGDDDSDSSDDLFPRGVDIGYTGDNDQSGDQHRRETSGATKQDNAVNHSTVEKRLTEVVNGWKLQDMDGFKLAKAAQKQQQNRVMSRSTSLLSTSVSTTTKQRLRSRGLFSFFAGLATPRAGRSNICAVVTTCRHITENLVEGSYTLWSGSRARASFLADLVGNKMNLLCTAEAEFTTLLFNNPVPIAELLGIGADSIEAFLAAQTALIMLLLLMMVARIGSPLLHSFAESVGPWLEAEGTTRTSKHIESFAELLGSISGFSIKLAGKGIKALDNIVYYTCKWPKKKSMVMVVMGMMTLRTGVYAYNFLRWAELATSAVVTQSVSSLNPFSWFG